MPKKWANKYIYMPKVSQIRLNNIRSVFKRTNQPIDIS